MSNLKLMTEDLDPSAAPPDDLFSDGLVVEPSAPASSATKIQVASPQEHTDPEELDTLFKDSIAGEIPSIKAKFQQLVGQHQVITDLEAVEQTLLGDPTMSQERARWLQAFLPDWIDDTTMAQFTQHRTRTHYATAVEHIRTKISLESKELDARLVEFHTNTIQHFKALIEILLERLRSLEHTFEGFLTQQDAIERLLSNKHLYVQSGHTFVSLLKHPIQELDPAQINWTDLVGDSEAFQRGLLTLKTHVCNPPLARFLLWAIDDPTNYHYFDSTYYALGQIQMQAASISVESLLLSAQNGQLGQGIVQWATKIEMLRDEWFLKPFDSKAILEPEFEHVIDLLSDCQDISLRLPWIDFGLQELIIRYQPA